MEGFTLIGPSTGCLLTCKFNKFQLAIKLCAFLFYYTMNYSLFFFSFRWILRRSCFLRLFNEREIYILFLLTAFLRVSPNRHVIVRYYWFGFFIIRLIVLVFFSIWNCTKWSVFFLYASSLFISHFNFMHFM